MTSSFDSDDAGVPRVEVRLYGNLNDLAWDRDRSGWYQVPAARPRSAKDVVESLGVPHTEVDLLVVNGESSPFDMQLGGGDRVSVYPPFATFDVDATSWVRPSRPAVPRFVADVHLGTLTRYLRLLGFDTWYRNDTDDAELAAVSSRERRILLSRDRGLLMRAEVSHGTCPRSDDPVEQLLEVARRWDLYDGVAPFTRCPHCNAPLEEVAKADVLDRIPPGTAASVDDFQQCTRCGQVYWRGAHHRRLRGLVTRVLDSRPSASG